MSIMISVCYYPHTCKCLRQFEVYTNLQDPIQKPSV